MREGKGVGCAPATTPVDCNLVQRGAVGVFSFVNLVSVGDHLSLESPKSSGAR